MLTARPVRQLLRRYDVTTVRPTQPWKSICYGIFFQKDFFVSVTRRQPPAKAGEAQARAVAVAA